MHGELDDFYLDLTNVDPEELESEMHVPAGKYHAVIRGLEEDRQSKNRCALIKFLVLAGTDARAKGSFLIEKLFLTEAAAKRVNIFGKRLGVLTTDAFGKAVRINWKGIVGKEVIIEVIEEKYQANDKESGKPLFAADGKPVLRTSSKLSFGGIWPIDDERVAAVPRAAGPRTMLPATARPAAPPANGRPLAAAATNTAAAPADDTSDF